jgi:hypothetical protein
MELGKYSFIASGKPCNGHHWKWKLLLQFFCYICKAANLIIHCIAMHSLKALPYVPGVTVITLPNIDQITRKQYELAEQQQKRILIIDNEPDVNIVLQSVLEQNGYRTDSYTDPVAAYKNFREGLYDLVILDIRMPVIDGFLLYLKIKATDSKVMICFLTATEYFHEEISKCEDISYISCWCLTTRG